MNGLKELKELIVGCVSNYIGKEKHDMSISGNEGMYAGGGLLGQATPHNTLLGNAAQQSTLAMRQSQLQMHMAQQQAQMAQNMVNSYHQAQQAQTPRRSTLSDWPLDGKDTSYTFEDLNDAGSVYNMELQTAIDLAINKFGSRWFKDADTADALEENTKFWIQVMRKLYNASHLIHERCHHVDRDEVTIAWKIRDTDHGNS